ncbi:hypothetical protein AbraIFM66951_009675 [Aspergillus brasiliensis]|uniref:alpha-galactosidase n=1 Tax=Aspergillus brasiliensis TaxID=319629 RepID=A0A9W5YVE7_9EURO|nr:hypothetical protein AbraCBS73388_009806 [Aspergillus brasiliensis]GKZ46546.1 hypothetical protein AbraIFM66951_009675 [Aspergillus brasiliensis]
MLILIFFLALVAHCLTIPRSTTSTNIWQPRVGASWDIVLSTNVPRPVPATEIYDIDMWSSEPSTVDSFHKQNHKVICYFSAGSYEPNKKDSASFPKEALGNPLHYWPSERWLDVRHPQVRRIMAARLDRAQRLGCDGVDPDNVDGYGNDNGFGLTKQDAVNYINWLAGEAHNRGLAVGLKNAGDVIPQVLANIQWSVNEECADRHECDLYASVARAGKPIFHIEYPKGSDRNDDEDVDPEDKRRHCEFSNSGLFSTVLKNIILDGWVQRCN